MPLARISLTLSCHFSLSFIASGRSSGLHPISSPMPQWDGVGMLLGPRALKTLNSIERIQPRMMAATFNGNPRATIISCYSPTNISEETELVAFYNELSSLVRSIPKHNVLVIGWDMNAQIGKNRNNRYSLHNTSNRNGQHLTEFMMENRLTCLNTNIRIYLQVFFSILYNS